MAIAVFFAKGMEEIEALTVVDLARREGIETWMVSIDNEEYVTGSHGITVKMDKGIREIDVDSLEMIVLPGGMPGTLHLKSCELLREKILDFHHKEKYLAAICAAPTVFGSLGILEGRKACCYPGMEEELKGAVVTEEKTVKDGHVITSRGMGTAIDFGLMIISCLKSKEDAERLKSSIVH